MMPASASSRPLGAAVVGLGVGEQHARAYVRTPNCQLKWVYDLDTARASRIALEMGHAQVAHSLDQILSDRDVHVVSIASYDDAHFDQVQLALRAGKHIFCEKPLCRSVEEVHALSKLWGETGRHALACNLVLRSAPVYRWLKDAILAGELGDIFAFDGDYLYGRLHKITEGWRKDVKDYSVIQGGGVHMVDLMLWLTGQRPVSVSAEGSRICTQASAFQYNDYVAATYRFDSGMIGRITANFGCVHRHHHVMRVFGTRATFIYDDAGARIHKSRDPDVPAQKLTHATLPAGKGDLIPGFVQAIVIGESSVAQTLHELDVISACVAADQATIARTTLRIDYAKREGQL